MASFTTDKKPRARDLTEVSVLLICLFLGARYDLDLLVFISAVYTVVACLGTLLGCFVTTMQVVANAPTMSRQLNTALHRCQPDDWWHGVHTSIWCLAGIIFIHVGHPTIAMFAILHGAFLIGWWCWIVGYSDNKLRKEIK